MTTPTPPRLTGNPKDDLFAIVKFLGDFFRSLVTEDQLPQARARTAAVDVTAISNPGADGKVISRTAKTIAALGAPPAGPSGTVNPIANPATQADLQKMANQIDVLTSWGASLTTWLGTAAAEVNAVQAQLNADTVVALQIVQAAQKQ